MELIRGIRRSGKTTRLLNSLNNSTAEKKIILCSSNFQRNNLRGKLETQYPQMVPNTILSLGTESLAASELGKTHLFIDNIEFLSEELVDEAFALLPRLFKLTVTLSQ